MKRIYTNNTNDHGNYRSYYKIRNDLDSRIDLLDKNWFYNKSILDIGCNKGILDIEIASKLLPKLIIGIDIDPLLIDHAKNHLKRLLHDYQTCNNNDRNNHTIQDSSTQHLNKPCTLFIPRSVSSSKNTTISNKIINNVINYNEEIPIFPKNIQFIRKDVFDISSSALLIEGKYDTITCFSITKWIHLNGGDEKLLSFFHRLFTLVKINGIVIIEYQPWKSYENNKSVNDLIKMNFNKILIKPEQFEDILVHKIGFIIESRLGCHVSEAKGFNRPILVLRRPKYNDNKSNHSESSSNISNSNTSSNILKYNISNIDSESNQNKNEPIAISQQSLIEITKSEQILCNSSEIKIHDHNKLSRKRLMINENNSIDEIPNKYRVKNR